MSSTHEQLHLNGSSGKPTRVDMVFLASLAGLLALVVYVGQITFREGLKTEETKANAEALLAWFKRAGEHRAEPDYQPQACALKGDGDGLSLTLVGCVQALAAADGPLAGRRNAFTGHALKVIERCTPSDTASAGQFVIEKVSPTPPGSAVATVVSPMNESDRINPRLLLRLLICDKGGYPIRVGETDF